MYILSVMIKENQHQTMFVIKVQHVHTYVPTVYMTNVIL